MALLTNDKLSSGFTLTPSHKLCPAQQLQTPALGLNLVAYHILGLSSSILCMKYTQYVHAGQTRLSVAFLLRTLYPKNAKSSRLKMEVTEIASAYGVLILKLPRHPKAGWRQTSAGKCLLHPAVKPNIRCGGSCLWLCARRAWHKPLFLAKGGFCIISTAVLKWGIMAGIFK